MTAIIPVNELYRIELDICSWQVSKWRQRRTHPNGGEYQGVSWHSTLESAVESLGRRLTSEAEVHGLQQVIAALHSAYQLVANAVEKSGHPNSWPAAQRQGSSAEGV